MKISLFIDKVYSKVICLGVALSIIILFISVYLYCKLPNTIPIHFNINGNADSWGNKANVFLLGIIQLIICILFSNKVALSKPMTFYKRIPELLVDYFAITLYPVEYFKVCGFTVLADLSINE